MTAQVPVAPVAPQPQQQVQSQHEPQHQQPQQLPQQQPAGRPGGGYGAPPAPAPPQYGAPPSGAPPAGPPPPTGPMQHYEQQRSPQYSAPPLPHAPPAPAGHYVCCWPPSRVVTCPRNVTMPLHSLPLTCTITGLLVMLATVPPRLWPRRLF